MNRILLLDPELPACRRISGLLEANGHTALQVSDTAELREKASHGDVVVADAGHLADSLFDRSIPVIILDQEPSIRTAVNAIKAGAAEYLAMDADDAQVLEAVESALLTRISDPPISRVPMVGVSPPMKSLFDNISKVAPTDSTVLISGESGTGKELVARARHASSERRYAPLIALNCATVPDALIESELFGQPGEEFGGLLAAAAGGTLFLDEVGELPPVVQSRLLQALEGVQDARLISATHRDLAGLVANGQFRDDLYYRLKVVSLKVPPLRERGDDILLLADAILARTMEKLGKSELSFADQTRDDLRKYSWPGNVRELENAIQRAVILTDGDPIETHLLAIEIPREPDTAPAPATSPDQTIEDYFVSFVTAHQDTMTETELAEKLGISRKSLWERRQRLNIPRKKTRKRGTRRDVS
jgi:DNA-binding NtrC family response regulator